MSHLLINVAQCKIQYACDDCYDDYDDRPITKHQTFNEHSEWGSPECPQCGETMSAAWVMVKPTIPVEENQI